MTALIAHGYSKAREALLDKKLVTRDVPKFTWDPLGNREAVKQLPANEFRHSRLRKWRLWSLSDPISWVTGLYAVVICLLLATPTLLFALQSSVEAQRRAEAAKSAAIAQGGILAAAITRTQNLMMSMSQACPGGPHGVPPVNWFILQTHGNRAVSALNDAKLALAKGQISDVLQQVNFAEGELDALVNGVHNSCAGASGWSPPGYNEYTSERDSVKANLDVLRRSLPPLARYFSTIEPGVFLACDYDDASGAYDLQCRRTRDKPELLK